MLVDTTKQKPWVMYITNNQARKVGSLHIFNRLVQLNQLLLNTELVNFKCVIDRGDYIIIGTALEVYGAEKSRADVHNSLNQLCH